MSGYRITDNQLRITRILGVKTETPSVKIFTFKDKHFTKANPGQFLMLWIPGVDEIPLSIMDVDKDGKVTVLVKNVGKATKALHGMDVGKIVGIRGPFGNSFTLKSGRTLLVGGGTGMAPLFFLAKRLLEHGTACAFVVGAKTKNELLCISNIEKLQKRTNVIATTEDGSYGLKCLATEPLKSLFAKETFDMVYTCGPEKMMRKVFDIAETSKTTLEASLERLMRCSIGLCGSCVIGKYRVCADGPVFTSERLRELKQEFGASKRDFDGKTIPLD